MRPRMTAARPIIMAMRIMITRIIMAMRTMPTLMSTLMATAVGTISMSTTSTAAIDIRAAIRTNMSTELAASAQPLPAEQSAALYRLMTWLSPAFPVGAFSYSSGIEWAVEAGDVTDAASLRDWLDAMLQHGAGFCDGVLLAQAHRAALRSDAAALRETAELAAAFVTSAERQLETLSQGAAFVEIARNAWACDGLGEAVAACGDTIAYPVAVGVVSAMHGVPLPATLHAFLHAVVSNWISAGARLIPLGQTDSQRLLAALEPSVTGTAARALSASLDDLGSATFRADLAAMRHETQYTRLFRS